MSQETCLFNAPKAYADRRVLRQAFLYACLTVNLLLQQGDFFYGEKSGMERENVAVNGNTKLFIVLLLVFSLFAGVMAPKVNADAANVTVKVLGEQGAVLASSETVLDEGETAFDALIKAVGQDQVGIMEYSWGKMVTSIKGLEAKNNYYWGFYINGISAPIGADSYKSQSGDTLTFRYQNASPAESVNLEIIGTDKSTSKSFKEISFIDDPNAFDLLLAITGPENVTYDQYDFGKMISSVFGLEAGENSFWGFHVNDEMQMTGAEGYTLEPGKTIQFKYETFASPGEEPGEAEPVEETPASEANAYPGANLPADVGNAISYIQTTSQIGEWEAIALKQAGKPVPSGYLDAVAKRVIERQGKFRTITEYERYTLGILAAGGNPQDFAGYNLVEGIYNGDFTKQGLNGAAYALIALDSANFVIPENAKWNQRKLVTYLLNNQGKEGGWGFDKEAGSDPDTTSMVLTALAPYQNEDQVKASIDKGITYLKGLFAGSKVDNSPAAAQAVIALSALGIDANGGTMSTEGKTLLAYLASFQMDDGGFAWKQGEKSDTLSTTQGLLGLVAYQLYKEGKGSLYSLKLAETPIQPLAPEEPQPEEPVIDTEQKTTTSESPATAQENGQAAEIQGHRLPDTATTSYTLLLIGGIMLVAGGILFIAKRRKHSN
ncbi:DUF4430 domain-containing protein [Bacillus sp. FJAT-27225]|uniref:DUF4430 domain-containing protein n=1 Tax=Bacillus sp. FJAT-27225 TaxID=1743144 RepID=UPI000A4C6D20|nr:DUF4430 domain-containing protein [Bacillus sp. FJAT-27225]